MTGATDLFNIANSTPAVVGPTGPGAISGGLLRPGSIDQHAFQQMLQAQQSARAAAGVGGKPVDMPILPFQNGIPTLTSAQFAALVGDQTPEASDSDDAGLAGDPRAAAMQPGNPTFGTDLARRLAAGHAQANSANPNLANPTLANSGSGGQAAASLPVAPALFPPTALPQANVEANAIRLSGVRASPMQTANPVAASDDRPSISRGPAGVRPVGQQGAIQTAGAEAAPAVPGPDSASDGTKPASTGAASSDPSTADGEPKAADARNTPPSDPNLVHLKEQPDRDMQMRLRLEHKQWVVDETPGSRQLFFGADGKFGWDDFLDVINPLQHIPIISQIYRAVTGDQINGAAEIIGALPFGPLGFVGMAGAIADLAVRDSTGKDIGENVASMVFGNDTGGTDNMAERPVGTPRDDATAAREADGKGDAAATQTASIEGRSDIESERVRRG
jgi:hypothetical protein